MEPQPLKWIKCNDIPKCEGHLEIIYDNEGRCFNDKEQVRSAAAWLKAKLYSVEMSNKCLDETSKLIDEAFGMGDE
jgi:hypothetical protein